MKDKSEWEIKKQYLKNPSGHIRLAVDENNSIYQISHRVKDGRRYYSGKFNLQNISRKLRMQILGPNAVEVDACAISMRWIIMICARDNYYISPALAAYVNDRTSMRKKIAIDVFGNDSEESIKKIKTGVNAIGFGNTGRRSGELFEMFGSEHHKKFFDNEDICCMRKSISAVSNKMKTLYGKQWNKEMHYEFARWERKVINELKDLLTSQGCKYLEDVHDAVYVEGELDIIKEMVEKADIYGQKFEVKG